MREETAMSSLTTWAPVWAVCLGLQLAIVGGGVWGEGQEHAEGQRVRSQWCSQAVVVWQGGS